MWRRGFTLIELLIVITILGILAAAGVGSLTASQGRARDTKKKAELAELKNALKLYYNDYQRYPAGTSIIQGCGATGTSNCPCSSSAQFATGASCQVVYMKRFPSVTYIYQQASSGDDFRLRATLERTDDPSIAASQLRCPALSGAYTALEFVFCAD